MTTASLLSAASGAGITRLSRSASRIVAKAAGGFHLLRVEAYSQTKMVPSGQCIDSPSFSIGGREWTVKYYPNGRDSSANSDHISLYIQLHRLNYKKQLLQAQYRLSILDKAGDVAYGLPAKTGIFKSRGCDSGEEPQLCGHEHFIRREDLERREDLIRDNCVVFRCDVGGFTELNTSCLAREVSHETTDEDDDDDEYGLKPTSHQHFHGSRRRRRPNDMEFAQWCLAQKRMG